MSYIKDLSDLFGAVLTDEPMSLHTSFKTGGNADVFVKADDGEKIAKAIKILKENNVPYYIIGNGSNLLVRDKGIDGVIIQLGSRMNEITVKGNIIYAQAGAMLSALSAAACEGSLTGIEFASGIPGTVGGAVFMNAGAYDGEIKNVIVFADVIDESGNVVRLSKDELGLSYRHSVISDMNMVVIGACFELQVGVKEEIIAKIIDFSARRRDKQPLNFPSAGSTFKRPEGYFAAKLIEDSGLKGKRIGGAQVSEKHAGFIVNVGGATSSDILRLIDYCIEIVYNKFNVKLEPEVQIIGRG
ncbi:MAG: UDP-N-acetylmuramate dehydrogenase [Candidatus Metalachnospira sp.]|nr:UDP-N-acetylmuramate dehydrogenase [Candidatus Metalachnospira sp.]